MKPASLLWGMTAVLVFGFVAIALFMMAMKIVGLEVGQILAFTILSFLIMLLIEGMFIWQLMRRKHGAEQISDAAVLKEQAVNELEAAQARLLSEAMPSVTEHTTRSLEPIFTERK